MFRPVAMLQNFIIEDDYYDY